jgi:hypothetical protein
MDVKDPQCRYWVQLWHASSEAIRQLENDAEVALRVPEPIALAQCPGCFSTQTPDVAQGNPGLGGGGPRVPQFAARLQF